MKLFQILINDSKNIPEKLPFLTIQCINNVKKNFHDYEYKLFSGQELEDILAFDKDVITAYKKLKPYSYKCDLARACLLYLYGGLYVDLHIFFLQSIKKDVISRYDFCAFRDLDIASMSGFAVQTGIIYAPAKSKVMEIFIEKIVENCRNEYYGSQPVAPTSTTLLGKALHKALENGQDEKKIHLLGSMKQLTKHNIGFVTNDDFLLALRMKQNDTRKLGIESFNWYVEMFHNKDIYDKDVKFDDTDGS